MTSFKALRRGPSLPTAIALLALAIAVTGPASAATGQLVNIVDPNNSALAARVDSGGNLKVAATPVLPAKTFSRDTYVASGFQEVIPATSSVVALSRVSVTSSSNNVAGKAYFTVILWHRPATADGVCTGTGQNVGVYSVPPGETVLDALPTPFQLKPLPGFPKWCLVASTAGSGSPVTTPRVDLHGYIVSGTISPTDTIAVPNA
jgi:hypothetical protein